MFPLVYVWVRQQGASKQHQYSSIAQTHVLFCFSKFLPIWHKFWYTLSNCEVITVNAYVSTFQSLKLLTVNKTHNKTVGPVSTIVMGETMLAAPSNSNNETLTEILTLSFTPFLGR